MYLVTMGHIYQGGIPSTIIEPLLCRIDSVFMGVSIHVTVVLNLLLGLLDFYQTSYRVEPHASSVVGALICRVWQCWFWRFGYAPSYLSESALDEASS